MIFVCHNSCSEIYDNGDHWLWKRRGKEELHQKNEFPLLPLAAVIKYEMIPDNQKILDELRELAQKEIPA